uniref:Chondroitin proteoglycan 4 domain-containing protein n=1 Tax=Plectus sambesii TaxID=2011161 RepID=A0A914WYG2_9BILA
MFGLALTAVLLVGVSGNSIFRSLQNMNYPCLKKCIDKGNTTIFDELFDDIDEICTSMVEARDCVAKCNVPFNPFDMKTVRSICSEERRAEMKKHSACYKDQGNATHERCNKMCGSTEKMFEDMQGMVASLNKADDFNFSTLFDSMGGMCTTAKCYARCSRESFNELCRQSDPTAGSFMQQFHEDTLTAMNEDLKEFGIREFMKGILPKECNYMFNPAQLSNYMYPQ